MLDSATQIQDDDWSVALQRLYNPHALNQLIAFALQISDFGNFLIEQGNLLLQILVSGLLVAPSVR